MFRRPYKRLYYWLRKKWDYRLRQLRQLRRRRRGGPPPDAEEDKRALVIWERSTSPDLFYVFQGRAQRLMMEPLTFFRTTGLLDANLVLLRDRHEFFYHAGISGELADVDAVRERLRAGRRQMPHVRRTFCLGTSMGGYAALLFGHYLKADVVYAFAPQTLLDLERLGAMAGRTDTWRFPDEHRDLALLLADYNGHTRYKVFYCEGSARDRRSAERLRGLGGVELCPQPGDSHQVVQEMDTMGLLSDALLAR